MLKKLMVWIRIWGKWLVLATVIAILGTGIYFYQRGDIHQKLYEHQKERLAKLDPLPGLPITDMAFMNVSVVAMTTDNVLDGQTVLIRDGRIAALGPVSVITVPEGVEVIDGTGVFLMPGLADMHVHTSGIALNYSLLLANGITTIRETAGMPKYLDWAKRVENGEILGPTIYTTGPIITGRNGGGDDAIATTAEDARAEVIRQYEAGYRMIKPYNFLTAEAYRAVMEEAKARGMYVVGHAPYSLGIDGVVALGQDELAHIHSFHQDFFKDFTPETVFDNLDIDESLIPEIVEKIRAAGVRVCVTLIVNQTLLDSKDLDSYLARPMQAYEIPVATTYMKSRAWYFNKMWSRDYLEEKYLPWLYKLTGALHEAGVLLVLGTDAGGAGLVHGFSPQEELRLLVKAGLSPYEALLTGTRNAAIASGDPDVWGTVEVGKRADLILLSANPLENVRNAQSIVGVMKAGQWLDRAYLDHILENVVAAY